MTAMDIDAYARISDDQADDAHGVTNQLSDIALWASDHGHTIVDVYRDDSISATSGKTRPGFEALLARAVKRPVVVWHTDRLMRLTDDLNRVIKQDLTVYSVRGGPIDLSNETGKAMARTVTAWAEHEVKLKSQRQVLANKAIAAAGRPRWRVAPYGHGVDGSLIPAEAAVIREAAERVLRGDSVRSVRTWLGTVDGAPRTNVARLLMNPRMVGHNYYRGERINASDIVPILSDDDYSDLVRLLSDPARATSGLPKGKVSTLLTGIAKCGLCGDGSTMHARTEVKGGVNKPMYKCAPGNHNQHPRLSVDTWVTVKTWELLGSDEAPRIIERHSSTPENVKDELKALRGQLEEWQAVASEMGPVEYMKVTKPIRARIGELDEISRQTSHRALFEGLGFAPDMDIAERYRVQESMRERWDALPLLKQREIISTIWDITLMPRDRPRGPASSHHQHSKIVMTER